jgi:2-oxoglutarate ferredoxin oxidoreductase subunit alpha
MTRLRQAKVDGIADDVEPMFLDDPNGDAEILVLGWGSTFGPIGAAVEISRREGLKVAQAHLVSVNPFPENTGEVLKRYKKIIIPEMNLGQLNMLIRAKYLVDSVGYNKVRGLPFKANELVQVIKDVAANV